MTPLAKETISGLEAVRLHPEHLAGAAEPANHLVGDEQDIVPLEDRGIAFQYVAGGTITPPAPCTGSPIMAAIVSAPSRAIISSSSRTNWATNPASSRPFSLTR